MGRVEDVPSSLSDEEQAVIDAGSVEDFDVAADVGGDEPDDEAARTVEAAEVREAGTVLP
ncbi:MAG: hypothetical protein AAGI46_03000 [Planctomycetota bacterium]